MNPKLHGALATPAMTRPAIDPLEAACHGAAPGLSYPGIEPQPRLTRGIAWALSISIPVWAGFVAILWRF